MSHDSRIKWLTAWAEPDGDQDTLVDVRVEVRWLLKRACDLEAELQVAKLSRIEMANGSSITCAETPANAMRGFKP